MYTLLETGVHKKKHVRYLAAIKTRASELLGRPAVPGVDYVNSEVVHCANLKGNMGCQRLLGPVSGCISGG